MHDIAHHDIKQKVALSSIAASAGLTAAKAIAGLLGLACARYRKPPIR